MFEKDVWRWGAIDVKDPTGPVRRGMICDMDPSKGMTVDFDYPGHNADLIPFSRCVHLASLLPYTAGDAVEILARHSPSLPWRWYPGQLLAGSWCTYAFVEADVEGVVFQGVVPLEKVRGVSARVPIRWKDKYIKYEVEMPKNPGLLAGTKKEGFWNTWDLATGTRMVKVERGKLVYLSSARRALTKLELMNELRKLVTPPSTTRGTKRTIDDEVKDDSEVSASPSPCINRDLPPEVISNIFSFLDVDEQIKCRKVCQEWNFLLGSFPVMLRVQIDLAKYHDRKLAWALDKMVTASTKVLVFMGNPQEIRGEGNPYDTKCHGPFRTVMHMLQAKRVKIPFIIISGRIVWADDLLNYTDRISLKFRSEWVNVCDHLVLEQSKVLALYEAQDRCNAGYGIDRDGDWERYWEQMGVEFRFSRGVLRTSGGVAVGTVLDLLEGVCPAMTAGQKSVVERLMGKDYGEENQCKREAMLKVLKKWQPDDPRFGPSVTWSEINFPAIDLDSLRTVTLYALLYRSRIPRDDEENWDGVHVPWQDRYRVMCGLYDDDF